MHQHRFRLISRMMPGGNQGVLAHHARRSFQESVSSVSRRRFQGEAFPRGISGDILANDVAGRPMRLGESPHEVGVGHRSRAPYPMLKMRNPKRKTPFIPKRKQDRRQRQRIRTARTGDDDAAAQGKNPMPPYKSVNAAL